MQEEQKIAPNDHMYFHDHPGSLTSKDTQPIKYLALTYLLRVSVLDTNPIMNSWHLDATMA